jgi:hypothetical protein
MRKETYAGVKAGLVVNLLFSLWPFVLVLGVVGLVGVSNPFSTSVLPFFLLGLLLYLTVMALIGVVLGVVFAVVVDKLPLRSTYSKALILCLILWILVVSAIPTRIIIDLLIFGGFIIESLCFAYLYRKWTKSP